MKRTAATALIVAGLLVVAIALGIANKLRTDRRAKTAAESLNRKDPLNGSVIQAVPGADSTSEPGAVDPADPMDPESADDSTPKRLNITELRAGVRAGDMIRVAEVGGTPVPDDAEELFKLISELPGEVSSLDRKLIIKCLMKHLRSIPGEQASRLLLLSVRMDGFIPPNEWIRAVNELAERGHPGTFTYLESVAFSSVDLAKYPEAGTRAYLAAELLVKQDAERYLPAIAQRVRVSNGSIFSGYLGALTHAPPSAHPEIGKLVPLLRERYRDLPAESNDRYVILDVVSDYAKSSRSEEWRQWALAELTNWKSTQPDDFFRETTELFYQILLSRLEQVDR